jgi:hypothetical protein
MHSGHVMRNGVPDPRYLNICSGWVDYTPVAHDWLIEKARKLPLGDYRD